MRWNIKNNSWLFLIWEIIKKITHYYFNKKIPLKQLWMRKIGSKQYEEQFSQLMILILSNIGDYRYNIIMIIVKIISWN